MGGETHRVKVWLPSVSHTEDRQGCAGQGLWVENEAPLAWCAFLKAAATPSPPQTPLAYMDDLSDKGNRFQHFVIRQRKNPGVRNEEVLQV